MNSATQQTRHLAVFTPLGDDALLLKRINGREELSRLFEYELELLSERDYIAARDVVGRNVTFTVDREEASPRYFNGYVRTFAHVKTGSHGTSYCATVVPWTWFLTQQSDCRIFQQMTTPQIVEQVFRRAGFTDFDLAALTSEYAAREYCVQYRETDFDFVSRLLEEEGIFYYFRHENGVHTLVLGDHTSAYFDVADDRIICPPPHHTDQLGDLITHWEHDYELCSGRIAHTDYDFRQPLKNLQTEGQTRVDLANVASLEVFEYPGRYEKTDVGSSLSRVRMEELEVDHDTIGGVGTYRTFTPGARFTIDEHRAKSEVGKSFTLTSVEIEASVHGTYISGSGDDEEMKFVSRFKCIPDDVTFRPARITPRPQIGPQTAVIVGPRGEEIYTDEHARVKCQFYWDREHAQNEDSSRWIRVSQEHAGKGWGAIDLPRIGEEVIVSFLDGDPDRPIIKGRVYNAEVTPPFSLQGGGNSTNKTRSGGKTDTYQGSGYNEMTMDDTPGQEQLRVNGQHNMDANVNNDQTLNVGVDVDENINNDDAVEIAVDSAEEVGVDRSSTTGVDESIEVGSSVTITAGTSITLKCGASTIHMNKGGVITISGTFVSSLAKANHAIVAPMTEVAGTSMLLQAGIVALDLGGINKVGGGATMVNGSVIDARGGLTIIKGTPLKLGSVGAPLATLATGGGCGGGSACGKGASNSPPGGLSHDTAKELSGKVYEDLKVGDSVTVDGQTWKVKEIRGEELAGADGYYAAAFEGPDGQIAVAFRGTQPLTRPPGQDGGFFDHANDFFQDWGPTNLIQGLTVPSGQYHRGAVFVGDMIRQNPNAQVVTTGHSLGGGVANYASGIHGVPGVGFNSAPLGLGSVAAIGLFGPSGATDSFVHYNNNEIVSSLPGFNLGTVVTYDDPSGEPSWQLDDFFSDHSLDTINKNNPVTSISGPLSNEIIRDRWQQNLPLPGDPPRPPNQNASTPRP